MIQNSSYTTTSNNRAAEREITCKCRAQNSSHNDILTTEPLNARSLFPQRHPNNRAAEREITCKCRAQNSSHNDILTTEPLNARSIVSVELRTSSEQFTRRRPNNRAAEREITCKCRAQNSSHDDVLTTEPLNATAAEREITCKCRAQNSSHDDVLTTEPLNARLLVSVELRTSSEQFTRRRPNNRAVEREITCKCRAQNSSHDDVLTTKLLNARLLVSVELRTVHTTTSEQFTRRRPNNRAAEREITCECSSQNSSHNKILNRRS
ncbi:hypothetical protein J6590_015666 [Homalodisca vitripennis]|nr:hypothetical protein J6590_015666 [Homalodisca vitripennis]